MTDRELLEAAAKAAGIKLYKEDVFRGALTQQVSENGILAWNPLTSDGDALRLMVKLPFRELYVSEIGATVSWRRDDSGHGFKCDEYAAEHGGSLEAATRRAIVRAAAEISKGIAQTNSADLPEDNYYKSMAEAAEVDRARSKT